MRSIYRVQRICVRIERSEIRIARKLSKLEPKVLLRNFPSVEQIQDSGSELRLESFAKVEDLKHNSEMPLNASDQDKSRLRQFYRSRVDFSPPNIELVD